MIGKAVEQGACGNAIGSRVWKYEPVAALLFRKLKISFNNVVWIASTSPDNRILRSLIRGCFQWLHLNRNLVRRVHVEALIDAVGDVIMENFFAVLVGFHVLRVDVGHQRERVVGEVRSRLRDHFDLLGSRKVFLQVFVNYFRNARLGGSLKL